MPTYRTPPTRVGQGLPAPRTPGGRYIPTPVAPAPGYDQPRYEAYVPPSRSVAISATILDAVIPVVYGSRRVAGLCGARKITSNFVKLGYVFAFGEQDSISKVYVNGDEIYPTNGLDWISSVAPRVGNGSSAIGSILSFLSASEQTNWKRYCHVGFAINKVSGNIPGSLVVTADVGGHKITDFRTAATGAYTNPALIAYHVLTDPIWRGISSALIDTTDTWDKLADWCDETMSDSTERYHYRGIVDSRDSDVVVSRVLDHCFAKLYYGVDGKIKVWYRGLAPAITGTWSGSGSQLTEDGAAGSATGEVAAGDIIYAGTVPCIVVSVPDDDTINVDRSVASVSAKKVRLTSGVYIRKEDWVNPPSGSETPLRQIPDEVVVRYTLGTAQGGLQYPKMGDITGDKRIEINLDGCTSAAMARRWSESQKNILALQPFQWAGVVGGSAAPIEPGDVVFFDDDVLTFQPARVLPPVQWDHLRGIYTLNLEEFDPSAYSEGTAVDDTPPTETGWNGSAIPGSSATVVKNTTGSTIAALSLCYISGDDSGTPLVTLADADAVATCSKMLVMVLEEIANNATGSAMIKGEVDGFSSRTAGATQYVSTTAGGITETIPSGQGDVVRIIGYAMTTTKIYFDPSSTYQQIATTVWYNTSWTSRIKVTIDHTKVYETATYPVLITHDNMPLHFWSYVQNDGGDIVVTSSDGVTKIDRDVVKISVTDSCLVLRFLATLSSSTDTEFYIYYGNSTAAETDSTDAYPATLKMYLPFDEVETGAPSTLYDRTSNNNDATAVSIAQNSTPANVGYVIDFDGTNDYAYVADAASLDITNNLTAMIWVRGTDATPDADERILAKYKTSDGNRSWMMSSGTGADGAKLRVVVSDNGTYDSGHRKSYTSSVTAIENGAWHHLAFTFASGTLKLYVDGVEDTSVTKTVDDSITSIYSGSAPVTIAANGDYGERWGTGYLDEAKVWSAALSANVIKTIHANEGATEAFYTTSGSITGNVYLNIGGINGVGTTI